LFSFLRCFKPDDRQLDLAVIHTVNATMLPMPKIQRNKPSETGPKFPNS